MLENNLSINTSAATRPMLPGVKTNSTRVLSAARREYVLRLARQAVGRLLAEEFQRWQRLDGLDYTADDRSTRLSREHLKVAWLQACN